MCLSYHGKTIHIQAGQISDLTCRPHGIVPDDR
jgi:hypothetical protein